MAEVKVRHAFARFTASNGKREVAYRGQYVTVTQADLDANPDAFVSANEPLVQRGTLEPIAGDATHEELVFWLHGATLDDVAGYVARNEAEYPDVADRVSAAGAEIIDTRVRTQAPGTPIAAPNTDDAFVNTDNLTTITPAPLSEVKATPLAETSGDENLTDQVAWDQEVTYEDLVSNNATVVVGYLDRHPEEVENVAEAENDRNGGPRQSVTRAIEAIRAATQTADEE